MKHLNLPPNDDRAVLYLRYKVEKGIAEQCGDDWATNDPYTKESRKSRLERELGVIERQGFPSYFLILAEIMDYCREVNIPYGPGRGSVGGCYVAYALGIHEVDSLEFDLLFERFLAEDRAVWPDVDMDFSQRDRGKILAYIRERFQDEYTVVLQVAAFARAGGKTTVDMVAAARSETEPDAFQVAELVKKKFPHSLTGGAKAEGGEIHYFLESDGTEDWEDVQETEQYAEWSKEQKNLVDELVRWGWFEDVMALDGVQTNLAKHAAGVVLLSRKDLERLPQCGAEDVASRQWNMLTGYDMYSLEALSYLKYDILGLRTLDLLADAHKFIGGGGSTRELMKLWRETSREGQEDAATIDLFKRGETLGVFQVETAGFRHLLKEFEPETFEHIVQLNALYRPGALDFERKDGLNMVQVFTKRKLGYESARYEFTEHADPLEPILGVTNGIILYQEQSMQIAKEVAGFTGKKSDELRKAIGKKQKALMDGFKAEFTAYLIGVRGWSEIAAVALWNNIAAAARYSWNKSHSVEYGLITWLCGWFKANHPAAFYTAYINSWSEKMEKQSEGIAEARQHCTILPPDINLAEVGYTVVDGAIVFGLNGIKGMGEANRDAIILERVMCGPFKSFQEFHERLPSVPINMKLSLIQCGAFDRIDDRNFLLATAERVDQNGNPMVDKDGNPRFWTIAEFIKHNTGLKKPRPMPTIFDVKYPTMTELAKAELDTIGFYVSSDPMPEVTKALARLDNTIHWGGTIESVKPKTDKNGGAMAMATLLTNALTKEKLTIFASVWPRVSDLVEKDKQVIVRGRADGRSILVDGVFIPGDYRHIQKLRRRRGDEPPHMEAYNGDPATIEWFENEGYTVELV